MDGSRIGVIPPESRSYAGATATGRGWTSTDIPDQTGRTVLVTGANSGLGFLTCLELARHGARVIMTARDLEKGRDAQARILAIDPKARVDLRQLDLADLGRRLKAAGVPVKSVLAHPGYAATNLQLSGPGGILKLFLRFGNRFLAQPAEMGVLPQLYASTAPQVEGGLFIGPDGKNEKKGYPTRVQPVEAAQDTELARRLWQLSEDLTGVRFDFSNTKRVDA